MRCLYMACAWLALDALLVYGLRMACTGCGGCIWPVLDALLVYIWSADDLRWMRCLLMASGWPVLDALLVYGLRIKINCVGCAACLPYGRTA
jgi:NAD-dependent dihydropyrimidine dehydrogenase PreA subunit